MGGAQVRETEGRGVKERIHGLWWHHHQYRKSTGRALAMDLVSDEFNRDWYCPQPLEKWRIVAQCVYRYMRLNQVEMRAGKWNELVTVVATRSAAIPGR